MKVRNHGTGYWRKGIWGERGRETNKPTDIQRETWRETAVKL